MKSAPFDEPLKVNVTDDDIHHGKPKCGNKCPIAIAIKRALGGINSVWVEWNMIEINGQRLSDPPLAVADFIEMFDDEDEEDYPDSFSMTLPVDGWERFAVQGR